MKAVKVRKSLCFALAVTASFSSIARAQQPDTASVLSGRVVSRGAPLSGVEVAVQGLQGSVTTDSAGRFRLAGLRPGSQVVVLRRVGFAPLRDTVLLAPGAETERTYTLEAMTTQLDTLVTSAEEMQYLSPRLQDFERRRKVNTGGYFMGEAEIRKVEGMQMPNVLRRIPGLNFVQYRGQQFARSGSVGSIGGDDRLNPADPKSPRGCWISIYIDGVRFFDGRPSAGSLPPDIASVMAMNLSGVEYYARASSMPLQFKSLGGGCGTLLLWSRGR